MSWVSAPRRSIPPRSFPVCDHVSRAFILFETHKPTPDYAPFDEDEGSDVVVDDEPEGSQDHVQADEDEEATLQLGWGLMFEMFNSVLQCSSSQAPRVARLALDHGDASRLLADAQSIGYDAIRTADPRRCGQQQRFV